MTTKPKLLVEGWRFLPHSYAIVNQWQLLALARRLDVQLKIRDLPFPYKHWQAGRGLLPAAAESVIGAIPAAAEGETFDAVLRMGFPYDFELADAGRTAIFVTSEYQALPPSHFKTYPNVTALREDGRLSVITPSRWSAAACDKLGFLQDQISVVPHGIAPEIFRPDASRRAVLRRAMKTDGFLFFSNGAMTPNKGIDLLLQAFAVVASKRAEAQLLLKGLDPIHHSASHLGRLIEALGPKDRKLVSERSRYLGTSLSSSDMAALYQGADAYVSAYRAEAFNIPVLEAAASGLPVICTGGGATEDFVNAGFAQKINSRAESMEYEGLAGQHLLPDLDHLIELMLSAMDSDIWRENAAVAGPSHAHSQYSWDVIADRLLRVLFSDNPSVLH